MLVKVYELRDPRDESKSPRYVGITTKSLGERLRGHLCEIARTKHKSYKISWIKKLLKTKVTPTIHLIEEVEGWEYACEVEQYWIKEFREQGYKLTNTHRVDNENFYKTGKGVLCKRKTFKPLYILDLNFNIVYEAVNAQDGSYFIYNTTIFHKKVTTNSLKGLKTNKKFYVIKKEDYANKNFKFRGKRVPIFGRKHNTKPLIYKNIKFNSKTELQIFLNLNRYRFERFLKEEIKNNNITLINNKQ